MSKKIRVLVIDDSALVRQILSKGLSEDKDIEVVGTAPDPYVARDKIIELKPDVLTLDIEMPRMDGVEFLRKLMPQYPLPTLIVSSLTPKGGEVTLSALEAGAIDFVTKPSSALGQGLASMMGELQEKVKLAAKVNVRDLREKYGSAVPFTRKQKSLARSTDKVIVIGASTGGTEAIRYIVQQFPRDMAGVAIVQHMPPGFTKQFAKHLNDRCLMEVKEAESGDRILQGRVLIAPGDRHMKIQRSGGQYLVDCQLGEKICGHMPSVEVFFQSVAEHVGANAVGAMLTGMGKDGAQGMLAMKNAGARTLAQDKATSVVFGMPNEAFKLGGAEKLVALENIPGVIINFLQRKGKR